MATKRDYYEILGVSKNATEDEIKKAYRASALKHHPDKDKSPGATERFKEINEAYEVLADPQKKSAYDQFGHAAFEPGGMGAQGPFGEGFEGTYRQGPFTYYTTGGGQPFEFDFGGFTDPFEIFEQFFGGSPFGTRRRPRRPAYSLTLDFWEAVKGTQKEVEIAGKRIKIKIPAGVDTGSRIRFNDFDLITEVKPDKTFKREGSDLFIDKEITFIQATLGDIVEVPTIDGNIKLKVQPGTKSGTMIRLKDKGVPHVHENSRGDQYIRINIVIPTKLTPRQKDLLREFEDENKAKKGWLT